MKQSPIFQIAAFLFIIAAVECHPATKTIVTPAPGTDPNGGTGQFALTQTMGETSENSCRGNKMTWKKGQASWEKLQLATNLNLYQNVWQSEKVSQEGMSDITCISFNQGNLAWTNDFQMPCAPQHNNQVKTYTNVAWAGSPIQLSNVTAFKTAWNWKFTKESKDLVLDVSYDIFLTKDRNCRSQSCASREIMIWLAAVGGARPAGQRVPVNGKPSGTFKIASKYEFQVWKGVVGVPVISIFPAQEGRRFTSFQADLKQVLANLGQFGVGQDEYILSVGAGIEVFKGQGTFSTSKYTLDLY